MRMRGYLAVIAALAVLACYFFYSYMRLRDEVADAVLTADAKVMDAAPSETPPENLVTFYICGEVREPEVYSLPRGSRIIDAIELAGGATEQASFELMESVAAEITDGQKIYVPNAGDDIDKIKYMNNNDSSVGGEFPARKQKDPDVVVNINAAETEELSQIPGIGEATAKLIYDYRTQNGDFAAIEDIMNVPRIGEKTFENIKKNITVE